ncbi:FAS1-like dehydratase domain-containing protein [Alicycliphilus denitrificans]|uniref:Acyl-CoA dehydrogenase n=1 Tax=Alicycliphilus denitrificans TaxID=179636 RepID=A0A3R7F1N4_9BURK|nr:MaoC family dehydratase N-terminal domain-containing protein [Alicycliphilus denitrificans]RKJ99248.1 acyl-CoA dehydrogenase [Alicycliphilus denitrificans]
MAAMTDTTIDTALLAHLQTWQGRTETLGDSIAAVPVQALSATLDRDDPAPAAGTPLPPLWHWMYFLPHARASEIGPDGHPKRGGFLPPVPLPRRMWAGGRLAWEPANPLCVGQQVQRRSTIRSVKHKAGRTGELLFVLVEHQYHNERGLALTEEHDIVYRSAPTPHAPTLGTGVSSLPPEGALAARGGPSPLAGDPAPPPQTPPLAGQQAWSRTIAADDVLLFRYSALTFNGHRIHYDRKYVTEVEGYPGLIVHGPLIATLLLDLLRREMPGAQVAAFDFRAVRPTFDLHPFSVHGRPSADGRTVELWAQDHEGFLTMQGTATLA